jgi:hypothetical protein
MAPHLRRADLAECGFPGPVASWESKHRLAVRAFRNIAGRGGKQRITPRSASSADGTRWHATQDLADWPRQGADKDCVLCYVYLLPQSEKDMNDGETG